MAPLPVGLPDSWTIAMFNILHQDFYIFPMSNITTWTIGLLDYCSMFSINTLTHLLEYKRPCTVGLSDYWTVAKSISLHVKI